MPESPRTYTIAEVLRATGLTQRTLQMWTRGGIVRAPELHGPATRYDETYLLRALAAARLRKTIGRIERIRERLDAASPQELAALAGRPAPAPAPSSPVSSAAPEPRPTGVAWRRIVLIDGLELHVRDGAPAAAKLAGLIAKEFGSGSQD